MLKNINYIHVGTSIASFLLGIIVKTILDLRLGIALVKYFWWISPRWIFGDNPLSLAGTWDQVWEAGGSADFAREIDRHSHPRLRQLGPYCYAEFITKGKRYYFFGRVMGQYFVGEWFDCKDRSGYYGTFELRIINSDRMEVSAQGRHLDGL